MNNKSEQDKIKTVNPNFSIAECLYLKELKKEIKNRGNFCSNIQISLSWKDIVKKILNNTEYFNDQR